MIVYWYENGSKEPPIEEKVLVSIFDSIYIGFKEDEYWHYLADNGWNTVKDRFVDRWMPLPKQPKFKEKK